MTLGLYTLLLRLLLPLALARLYWRGLRIPGYRRRIAERLALERDRPAPADSAAIGKIAAGSFRRRWASLTLCPSYGSAPPHPADIWVHAVSVGETQAAAVLIRRLLAHDPPPRILVTTTTPTGADRLRELLGDRVEHRYTPYDLPSILERFLDRTRPRLLVILETEIWPNMLAACARRGIPALLVNARLSERSAHGYARFADLTRATLGRLDLIAAQHQDDAARFIALGAPPARVRVTGSIKFDVPPDPGLEDRAEALRRLWGANRPVWVAASTHEGEEEAALAAHRRILAHLPAALLVLVPRHPDRFERVAALVERGGFALARRSRQGDTEAATGAEVLLGDTMGELTAFLAAGDAAFIGGSLVPVGGHNVLEAAAVGVPVAIGPHTFNFAAICKRLIDEGAATRIADAEMLASVMRDWLGDAAERARIGELGRRFVAKNRGALELVVGLVERRLA